ncbi:hypothetical protein D3C71_1819200 [compost metagenome]
MPGINVDNRLTTFLCAGAANPGPISERNVVRKKNLRNPALNFSGQSRDSPTVVPPSNSCVKRYACNPENRVNQR